MVQRCLCRTLFVCLVLCVPVVASAQAISGVVTDEGGGVVPGVTVTIASPSMIGGARTTVTDASGRYQFLRLNSGLYSVDFALEGFNTVKRVDIRLTDNFTAPVNAQMTVGRRDETITVVAESPLVDVVNVTQTTRLTADMLNTLPLGSRFINDIVLQIPGVDDAGLGTFAYRGNADTLMTVDGNRTTLMNGGLGPGAGSVGLAAGAYQEYTVSNAIESIDTASGGMRINVVPKDGGNRTSGDLYLNYSGAKWASKNLTPEYEALGVVSNAVTGNGAGDKLNLNIEPSIGGPILRDKLWYFFTTRYNRDDRIIAGSYPDLDPHPFRFEPDRTKNASVDDRTRFSHSTRLTWQASQKDKLAGSFDDSMVWQPHRTAAGFDESTQSYQTTPHQINATAKWTRTMTSRLLMEVNGSRFYTFFGSRFRDAGANKWGPQEGGLSRDFTPPVPLASQSSYSVGFLGTTNQTANSNFSTSDTFNSRAELTYIRSKHQMRLGASFFRGSEIVQTRSVGDVTYTLSDTSPVGTGVRVISGAPDTITARLPTLTNTQVKADIGVWFQEQFQHKRLTAKAGVRLDVFRAGYPDQFQLKSVWLDEQSCATNPNFCAKDLINWKDVSPRFSATYDLLGNGKIALKAGWARYVNGETTNTTVTANPLNNLTRTATAEWEDLDGNGTIYNTDGSVQSREINPGTANEGRFTSTTFGKFAPAPLVPSTLDDPRIYNGWGSRGYSNEINLGIDHQLLPRVALGLTFYHRTPRNQIATDNRFYDAGSDNWSEFCLVAPTSPLIPGGASGKEICGLYDITPLGVARRDTVITAAEYSAGAKPRNYRTYRKDLQDITDYTQGYDLSISSNLPRGNSIQGGFDLRRTRFDDCDFIDTPRQFCDRDSAFKLIPRITGIYSVPRVERLGFLNHVTAGLGVSAIYRGQQSPLGFGGTTGSGLGASWTACDRVAATCLFNDVAYAAQQGVSKPLGRSFTADPLGLTGGRKTVALLEPNKVFLPYLHTIDMRVFKTVNVGRYRLQMNVEMRNVLNNGRVTAVGGTYGFTEQVQSRTLGQPSSIMAPRQFRVGSTLSF